MGKKLAAVSAGVGLVVVAAVLVMGRREKTQLSPSAGREATVVERQTPVPVVATTGSVERPAVSDSSRERAQDVESRGSELRSQVSETVAVAAGLAQEQRYYMRMNAIRALGKKLTPVEMEALYLFLDSRFSEQHELSILAFNALKNDILNAFYTQEQLPEDLGFRLVQMYRDTGHDDVWRDYCIQHLGLFYEARWPKGAPLDDEQRKEILSAYHEAIADTSKPTAGTALIGMKRLAMMTLKSEDVPDKAGGGAQRYPEFEANSLADAALKIAVDSRACEGARITAMAMCGEIGKPDALPPMRVTAQTGESVMLRMSSIGALGTCGDSSDMELLQALTQDKEARIRTAAESAVKRLKARLGDKVLAGKVVQ